MSREIATSTALSTSVGVLIVKEIYDPHMSSVVRFEYELYGNGMYEKLSKDHFLELLLTEEETELAEFEHLRNKLADLKIMRLKLMERK